MNRAAALSPIRLQLVWDRLVSVVEEQAQALVRTGFSTSTREAGDLSAGVFDTEGRMLAQAVTGTPGHVNSMARSVGHFLDRFPAAEMREGDVFLTNDPWMGTGHLHDFTFVTPAFRGGRPVALFASTSHVVDVGGRGLSADGRQVYEEGIHIPIMRFAAAGKVDRTLVEIVAANVREPVQVVGDLHALAACNDVGARRLAALMDEFALAGLDEAAAHILARSEAATRAAIGRLRPGTWRNRMRIDGLEAPVDLEAALTVSADAIDVDFAGTSGISSFGINVPYCYTEAYAAFGVRCVVAPGAPNNAGSLAPIRVRAPEGCILNAPRPAPVAVRHVTGQMLPDLVFGCLAQALPGAVPAEGTSCLWNVYAFGGPGRVDAAPEALAGAEPFTVLSFHSGGTGARPGKDGLSATGFPSGVRSVPVEVTEAISPVVFWRKEYRVDSGGAGRDRGGLGQIMELGSSDDAPFAFSALFDRIDHPPRGRGGGAAGMAGRVALDDGTALAGKGTQTVPAGARVVIEMPGGGGLGDPAERDPRAVAEDCRAGLVSARAARETYRVALAGPGVVDEAATARLRARPRPAARGAA